MRLPVPEVLSGLKIAYSEAELNKLAFDALSGSVFGTWSIKVEDRDRIKPSTLFRSLGTAPEHIAAALMACRATAFWEYTELAVGVLAGYPVFNTARVMTDIDAGRLATAVGQAQRFNEIAIRHSRVWFA